MEANQKIQSEVLIVDDLSGTREVLREMLQEIGFLKIEEASNGLEALERLKTHRVGLIVSDFDMNKMTGLEFLFAVRKDPEIKDIPFIMLSGKTDPATIDKAQNEGKAHFLFKPIDYVKLEQKIMQLMRSKFSQ